MTYRNLLHRLAKDLDENELDMEVMICNPNAEDWKKTYSRLRVVTTVKEELYGYDAEQGQVVLEIEDL